MKLKIVARDGKNEASDEAEFTFHIYPESYWEPLAIASNNSVLVEESTSIAITRYDLQVESRAEMSPKDIIYMVRLCCYVQQQGTMGFLGLLVVQTQKLQLRYSYETFLHD